MAKAASKSKQAIKHTGREKKEQIVAEIVEKLDSATGLVFADYQGLTHKQLENLKRELKKLDSSIVVTKNSLLKLSLGKSKNFADYKNNEGLDRPTAAVFMQGDIIEPLKKIQKVIKELGLPKIKFGILDGALADESQVLRIASLPGRDVLIAQFVGTLNSPLSGLVMTLNANIKRFVMLLNVIARLPRPEPSDGGQAQNKPAEPAPAASQPISEQPAEEKPDQEPTQSSEPSKEEAQPVEAAVRSGEPALQNDAPTESGETPEASTQTKEEENDDQKDSKGGEN